MLASNFTFLQEYFFFSNPSQLPIFEVFFILFFRLSFFLLFFLFLVFLSDRSKLCWGLTGRRVVFSLGWHPGARKTKRNLRCHTTLYQIDICYPGWRDRVKWNSSSNNSGSTFSTGICSWSRGDMSTKEYQFELKEQEFTILWSVLYQTIVTRK